MEALKKAVIYCSNHDILNKFMKENSSEVTNMLITEYDYEEEKSVIREEAMEEALEKGREEGLEKGRKEGIITMARNALSEGIPIESIHKITGLDLSTIEKLQNNDT